MSKLLAKVIRKALSSNGCRIGTKEVFHDLAAAKVIVCSNSIPSDVRSKIEDESRSKNIPVYNTNTTSMELGRLCNKPFRISILSITDIENADLSSLLEEINKR